MTTLIKDVALIRMCGYTKLDGCKVLAYLHDLDLPRAIRVWNQTLSDIVKMSATAQKEIFND